MVTVEDQLRCQQETQAKLQALEHILIGIDGKNGMRSDLKEAIRDIEALEKWKTQAMAVFALINIFVVPVAVALLLHFLDI